LVGEARRGRIQRHTQRQRQRVRRGRSGIAGMVRRARDAFIAHVEAVAKGC
jgi:hypothetical protein